MLDAKSSRAILALAKQQQEEEELLEQDGQPGQSRHAVPSASTSMPSTSRMSPQSDGDDDDDEDEAELDEDEEYGDEEYEELVCHTQIVMDNADTLSMAGNRRR